MEDELGGEIMAQFVAQRPKTYGYSTNDNHENKKSKGTEKGVIKRKLKFENY